MDNCWYMCIGCKRPHSDEIKWYECSSCHAFYCEKTNCEIFKWGEKEQCGRCTKLLSSIAMKSSDILAWLAAKLKVEVKDIEEKYKRDMVKSGQIIDDSLCTQCGRKCKLLGDWVEEKDENKPITMGFCCICLDRQTEDCDQCLSVVKKELESGVSTVQMEDLTLD